MKDRFGRDIIENEDGTFSVLGEDGETAITVSNVIALDSMAPQSWVDPLSFEVPA